jgi:hypothetical protein
MVVLGVVLTSCNRNSSSAPAANSSSSLLASSSLLLLRCEGWSVGGSNGVGRGAGSSGVYVHECVVPDSEKDDDVIVLDLWWQWSL